MTLFNNSSTETVQGRPYRTPIIGSELAVDPSHRLPQQLDDTFKTLPKLTREQCGHIRHFHNMASQLEGDWSLMGSEEPGQEWDTARRYILSHMAYGAAAAHYHRLPAMRSIFKPLIRKLIGRMMEREVWSYWYLSSQSGVRMDPDLKELRKPWANPVCRENIMYSGHLLCMVSLYTMLFHDDTFDKEGSIVFDWNPLFWGMGQQLFKYSRISLQNTILKEMERENWMGVCCEPNMIFIICNQFPLMSMKYNDAADGTKVIDEVLPKYQKAWADKGFVNERGLFRGWFAPRQNRVVDVDEFGHSAWVMNFMPWNHDNIEKMYPAVGDGFLQRVGDRINVNPPVVANAIKDILEKEGGDPDSPSILRRAREATKGRVPSAKRFLSPAFGWIAGWLSEIAPSDLDKLLLHADTYLNPSWLRGGLYYARRDAGWDEDGNYVYMEPYSGNAQIGYSRLNVKGGQKKMWDQPWTKEDVDSRPWVDGVSLEQDVDCLRGAWDEEKKAMVTIFRTWDGSRKVIRPVFKMLPFGQYGIYVNGDLKEVATVGSYSQEITVDLHVGGEDVNLVVLSA